MCQTLWELLLRLPGRAWEEASGREGPDHEFFSGSSAKNTSARPNWTKGKFRSSCSRRSSILATEWE